MRSCSCFVSEPGHRQGRSGWCLTSGQTPRPRGFRLSAAQQHAVSTIVPMVSDQRSDTNASSFSLLARAQNAPQSPVACARSPFTKRSAPTLAKWLVNRHTAELHPLASIHHTTSQFGTRALSGHVGARP